MGGDTERAAVVTAIDQASDLDRRFAAFVHAYRDKARRLAWRLVGGDEAAADDVTQDALVKAYRGLARFREDAKLETWFFRILVHQAHSYRRWRAVREMWSGPSEIEPADPRPRAEGDPMLREQIVGALERLTTPQRDAFVLVHLEGFTVREAAEVMKKAEGTVKSHLQRALKSLRKELAHLMAE